MTYLGISILFSQLLSFMYGMSCWWFSFVLTSVQVLILLSFVATISDLSATISPLICLVFLVKCATLSNFGDILSKNYLYIDEDLELWLGTGLDTFPLPLSTAYFYNTNIYQSNLRSFCITSIHFTHYTCNIPLCMVCVDPGKGIPQRLLL